MYEIFNRQASLQIEADIYYMDDMDFGFEVPFTDKEELMTAKIKVKNLSSAKRNSIKNGQVIIINAGYETIGSGTIFIGKITKFSNKRSGTEWITEIQAIDSAQEWATTPINKTFKEGSDAQTILSDLLNELGIEISEMSLVENKTYPRGKVCQGKIRDVIVSIAVDDCKSRLMIRHSQIIINDPNQPIEQGYLLSPGTGLIDTTVQDQDTPVEKGDTTHKTNEQKEEEAIGVGAECFLTHTIGAGDYVILQSRNVNGQYKVSSGLHIGEYKGKYRTKLELKEI